LHEQLVGEGAIGAPVSFDSIKKRLQLQLVGSLPSLSLHWDLLGTTLILPTPFTQTRAPLRNWLEGLQYRAAFGAVDFETPRHRRRLHRSDVDYGNRVLVLEDRDSVVAKAIHHSSVVAFPGRLVVPDVSIVQGAWSACHVQTDRPSRSSASSKRLASA
jgi:hypothetical protein